MKKYLFLILFLLMLGASLLAAPPARAQAPVPTPSDDAVNTIAKEMYCPVCENIPLDVCPTQACKQWRELIRTKLAEGWDEQQIKEYMAIQYGDQVLAEPPRRGLHWLVYLLPPVFLLAGVLILWRVFSRMRPPVATTTPPPMQDDLDDAYLARLEAELRQRQEEK
ncbi:MAG: cytochrome c-type biogenesis protein CcmH [Anaerolineae bacterium]|jgi:cytochrome c-type biogenesis protein CcmH|nr:cytochrome c-type biogenesis protein CcmH [Anaerolineae bacterium]